jgi:N-acetylneuraminic acid mutarotase
LSDLAYASDATGLYIAGGTDGKAATGQTLRLSNVGADATWQKLAYLPEPVESAAGAIHLGIFYVVGGFTKGHASNKLWALDTSKPDAQWKACAPIPAPGRAYAALLAHGNFLYLFGGYAGPPGDEKTKVFADAYRYDPAVDQWELVKGFDLPGFGWCAVSIDTDHVMLAGRIDGDDRITDDVWLVDLKQSKPAAVGKLILATCCATPTQISPDTWWFVGGEPDSNKSRTPRISVVRAAKK